MDVKYEDVERAALREMDLSPWDHLLPASQERMSDAYFRGYQAALKAVGALLPDGVTVSNPPPPPPPPKTRPEDVQWRALYVK